MNYRIKGDRGERFTCEADTPQEALEKFARANGCIGFVAWCAEFGVCDNEAWTEDAVDFADNGFALLVEETS